MHCHEWLKTVAQAAARWYAGGMKEDTGSIGGIERPKITLTVGVLLFKPDLMRIYTQSLEEAFAALRPHSLIPLTRFSCHAWNPKQMLTMNPHFETDGLSTRQLGEFLCAPRLHPVVASAAENMLQDPESGLHRAYQEMHAVREQSANELLAPIINRVILV